MDNSDPLTPKQESFCIHYTTIGAETFSHGTKAAIAAGYSETSAYSQASALLKKPEIRERIKDLHAENMSRNGITVEKVLADLEHDKLLAREAGQFAVAKECSIAQGKYLAMFADRHLIENPARMVEMSEREIAEGLRIAEYLLRHPATEHVPALPDDGPVRAIEAGKADPERE